MKAKKAEIFINMFKNVYFKTKPLQFTCTEWTIFKNIFRVNLCFNVRNERVSNFPK